MLLDTCALLWLAKGGGSLSKRALSEIQKAPVVYVSAISGFEVALKNRQGKLKLPAIPKDWFEIVLEHHNLTVIPLDLEVCLRAAELPLIHRDPCDRFIIATAQLNHFAVATADSRFERYGVEVIT